MYFFFPRHPPPQNASDAPIISVTDELQALENA